MFVHLPINSKIMWSAADQHWKSSILDFFRSFEWNRFKWCRVAMIFMSSHQRPKRYSIRCFERHSDILSLDCSFHVNSNSARDHSKSTIAAFKSILIKLFQRQRNSDRKEAQRQLNGKKKKNKKKIKWNKIRFVCAQHNLIWSYLISLVFTVFSLALSPFSGIPRSINAHSRVVQDQSHAIRSLILQF